MPGDRKKSDERILGAGVVELKAQRKQQKKTEEEKAKIKRKNPISEIFLTTPLKPQNAKRKSAPFASRILAPGQPLSSFPPMVE